MLPVDLHMHTTRSHCGLHTLLEMLEASVARGLTGVAITDHGTFLKGPGVTSVLFRRFPGTYRGLRVWKGIEANVLPEGGTDVPRDLLPLMDVVLLGIHNLPQGHAPEHYSALLLDCLEAHPWADVLVHPDITYFPLEIGRVVEAAAERGVAVEFNNANLLYGKTDLAQMAQMAAAVRRTGCRAVIGGDAHTVFEIGQDGAVREALAQMGFERMAFVNDSYESAEAFIEERRALKRGAGAGRVTSEAPRPVAAGGPAPRRDG